MSFNIPQPESAHPNPDPIVNSSSPYGVGIARVSTILDQWNHDSNDGLLHWAATHGHGWTGVREEAAIIGTATHAVIEEWFQEIDLAQKQPGYKPRDLDAIVDDIGCTDEYVVNALTGFARWKAEIGDPMKEITEIETEVKMIDGLLKVGGTCDLVAKINGKRVMIDWKTSSHISRRYKVQLAAYAEMYSRTNNNHQNAHLEHFGVVRFDKITGNFEEVWWDDLTVEKEMFKKLVDVYNLQRNISLFDVPKEEVTT